MKVSLESSGRQVETEIEIYAKIPDTSILTGLASSVERQEQWGVYIPKTDSNNATGNMRVRYTEKDGYVFTSKVKLAGSNDELEFPVAEGMMEHMRLFADSGLIKTRYCIDIPDTGLVFECDAFEGPNGPSQWLKIDLELPEGSSLDVLPDLPFVTEEVRIIQPGHKNEADLAFVRKLFNEEFNVVYVPKPVVDPNDAPAPALESLDVFGDLYVHFQ